MFTEKRIIITESEDDFDCSSMERNEYYIIEPDNYLNLINKLEKEYKPMPIRKLSSNTNKYYELFKNDNLKKIFLLFLSLIGYDKKVKEENEKYMEAEKLINLLCGDEIKYKKEYYIKWPWNKLGSFMENNIAHPTSVQASYTFRTLNAMPTWNNRCRI